MAFLQKLFLLGIALVQFSACTSSTVRKPSSVDLQKDIKSNITAFKAFVESESFTRANCVSVLNDVYQVMSQATPNQFNNEGLAKDAVSVMDLSWQTRQSLRQKVREFSQAGPVPEPCLVAVKDIMRVGRYLEDELAALHLNYPVGDLNHPKINLTGGLPYLLLKDPNDLFEFKTGDIFLTRGNSLVSSSIARVAKGRSQFSHISTFYKDAEGKKWVIESWIDTGAFVWSLKEHLDSGNTRFAVFRNRDSKLAADAAEKLYRFVKEASDRKKPFPYDFTLNVKDHSRAFCSELVTMAYEWASGGKVQVPMYFSNLRDGIDNFIENVGIFRAPTFIPADMDVDPNFDLMLEWRDVDNMNATHQQDMVLDSVFAWMQDYDYKLHYSLSGKVGYLLQPTTEWPVVSAFTKLIIPANTTPKMVRTFATLQSIATPMLSYIAEKNQETLKKTGYHLTPRQMMAELEVYRLNDLKTTRQLHRLFSP